MSVSHTSVKKLTELVIMNRTAKSMGCQYPPTALREHPTTHSWYSAIIRSVKTLFCFVFLIFFPFKPKSCLWACLSRYPIMSYSRFLFLNLSAAWNVFKFSDHQICGFEPAYVYLSLKKWKCDVRIDVRICMWRFVHDRWECGVWSPSKAILKVVIFHFYFTRVPVCSGKYVIIIAAGCSDVTSIIVLTCGW